MAIYATIPNGMNFKAIVIKNQVNDTIIEETKDCFVDPNDNTSYIILQDIVKEALRTNKNKELYTSKEGIIIYLHTPPNTQEIFLKYVPERNGKLPTTAPTKCVAGRVEQKYDPRSASRYGMFWNQNLPLSADKEEAIKAKRLEQKANRQHIGDNPFPT